jgi:hypothetical protein
VALDSEFPGAPAAALARVNVLQPVKIRFAHVIGLSGVAADDSAAVHVHRMVRAWSHRGLAAQVGYVTGVLDLLKEAAVVHGAPWSQMSGDWANQSHVRASSRHDQAGLASRTEEMLKELK